MGNPNNPSFTLGRIEFEEFKRYRFYEAQIEKLQVDADADPDPDEDEDEVEDEVEVEVEVEGEVEGGSRKGSVQRDGKKSVKHEELADFDKLCRRASGDLTPQMHVDDILNDLMTRDKVVIRNLDDATLFSQMSVKFGGFKGRVRIFCKNTDEKKQMAHVLESHDIKVVYKN